MRCIDRDKCKKGLACLDTAAHKIERLVGINACAIIFRFGAIID
jgi:hypothetical protein